MRKSNRLRLAAVLGGAMVLALTATGTALADQKPVGSPSGTTESSVIPGGFKSWGELRAMQQKLNAAADRIVAANGDGFAGIVAAPENRELRVYWTGQVPATITNQANDVSVKFLPARYSQKALRGEASRLITQAGVSAVAPKPDGSGLTVASRDSASKQSLSSSVPVEQTVAAPVPASRGNDFPPYWGGARWSGCSTGFAVWHGGVTKMLSAGHCGSNGQAAYDGGGDFMGYVEGDDNAHDRLLINTRSAGRIYDGGVGVGEFSKPVIAAAHSYPGNWVCDSGAYSGAICGIQVRYTNVTVNIGYLVFETVWAEQVEHIAPIGNGDSGGPVFDLTPDYSQTIAKGTNTAIDTSTLAACRGVPAGGGRQCAWRFYYVDVVNSLNAYGAAIVTG